MNGSIEELARAQQQKYAAEQSLLNEIIVRTGEQPSLVYAINRLMRNPELRGEHGLQAMLRDELTASIRDRYPGRTWSGAIIPFKFLSTRGLSTSSWSAGGALAGESPSTLGQDLGSASVVADLGATLLPGIVGGTYPIRYVQVAATASLVTEGSAPASQADPTFAEQAMTPYSIVAYSKVSRRMLKLITPANEFAVRDALLRAVGHEIDRVALAGSGVEGEPAGLISMAGINLIPAGTDGAPPDWSILCDIEEAADAANDGANTAWITSSAVRKKLRKTQRASGLDFIWTGADLLGHPARVSARMPDDLTKGTSVGVCSTIVYGAFERLVVGFWGPAAIDLMIDPFSHSATGDVILVARAEIGVGLMQPKAFAVCRDLLAS